jgi:protein-tyrosine phosphatase
MTERFDWRLSEQPRDIIHQVVEKLHRGQTVAFPTSATYVLAAYAEQADALSRLDRVTGDRTFSPALGLFDADAVIAHSGFIGTVSRRLVERSLPGPLTLVTPLPGDPDLLTADVRRRVTSGNKLRVRVPAHESILESLRLLPEPLVLLEGSDRAVDGESAAAEFGSAMDCLVDAGRTPFGKPTTVVELGADGYRLLREGVIPSSRVTRLSSEIVTFLCTGNSCRSPMAEAIFRRMLADHLRVNPEQLPERGFIVQSAGLAAYDGSPAAENAQAIVQEYGATLEDHVAQTVTPQMVQFSDRIFVMTREHRSALVNVWPEAGPKVVLLGGKNDIVDPIGRDLDEYRRTAGQIANHLQQYLADIKSRKASAGTGD